LPINGKCKHGHIVDCDSCCGEYTPAHPQKIISNLLFENKNYAKILEQTLMIEKLVHGPEFEFEKLPPIFDNSVEIVYTVEDCTEVKD
jgi:hypothetical protein